MIDWLIKNKKFVKIRAIEQELGMPGFFVLIL